MLDALLIEPMYGVRDQGIFLRSGANFLSGSPVVLREPIAAEYVAGYLRYKGLSADVLQVSSDNEKSVLRAIKAARPRVVGVSIHSTHMYPRILDLIKKCKSKYPNIIIVCGGNHPTCCPEIVLEGSIDFVVRREGEETLYQLIKALAGKQELGRVKGISFVRNGEICHTPPAPRFDFTQEFFPVRKRKLLVQYKCAPLAFPPPPNQSCAAQISYSRGCPYKCEFCVSPEVFPGPVIYRNISSVIREIRHLQKTYGTNFLFFTDLSLNASSSKAYELCDALLANNIGIHWFCYCNMGLSRDLAQQMARAGCTRIGTGAEALVPSLLSIYKSQQRVEDIHRTLQIIDEQGILNRVYIMIGYPEETQDDLDATLETMLTLPIDQPRIAFVTPFPGTAFHAKVSDKLLSTDPEDFTGDSPVLHNDHISPEEYLRSRNLMIRRFYSSKEYHEHVQKKCDRNPHLRQSFEFFFDFLVKHDVIDTTPRLT